MKGQPPDDSNEMLNFIAATVEAIRERMATKDDIAALREEMATKDELAQVESRLGADIARLEVKLEAETTVIRGDIEQVRLHLGVIDNTLSTRLNQMEANISRLRSALYLLAKDNPDVLRLLGREPLS